MAVVVPNYAIIMDTSDRVTLAIKFYGAGGTQDMPLTTVLDISTLNGTFNHCLLVYSEWSLDGFSIVLYNNIGSGTHPTIVFTGSGHFEHRFSEGFTADISGGTGDYSILTDGVSQMNKYGSLVLYFKKIM